MGRRWQVEQLMNIPHNQKSIMVIDDEPDNLQLLENMLRQRGYDVRSLPSGRLALTAVAHRQPDLILLDINMPEITGIEVCKQLKADVRYSAIPIIFLSALRDVEDKVQAFRAGGVDYISKPFQFDEVYARVATHLKLRDLQKELKSQNEELEDMVLARNRQLAQAHARLNVLDRAKSDFLYIISHEFRTPLNGMLGVNELIMGELSTSQKDNDLKLMYDLSRQRLMSVLDDALLLTQIDIDGEKVFHSAPVPLSPVLTRAIARTSQIADSRHVKLRVLSGDIGSVRGQPDLLVRAFHALLDTAVRFTDASGTVQLANHVDDGSRRITIESSGRTISADLLEKFFDVFSIGELVAGNEGVGLRPSVAHRILTLFGANVGVENNGTTGIKLTISF